MMDAGNGTPSPTADRQVFVDEPYFRIPGRDSRRGEITHKRWREMNRQERRAILAADRRESRGRWR